MDESNHELKPCPFCGHAKYRLHVRLFRGIGVKLRQVECGRCGACGPPHLDADGEDNTEKFWNGRKP